jgi:C_GCAxxG_C_C family probable redox protein
MPSSLSNKATNVIQERKGSCSQAIFTAYGEHLSLGKVDYDTCMKIASAFSGGIAGTGNVCGALSGALMAIGLKYGGANATKADEVARKFLDEFKSLHGTILCREFIDHDLFTDEDVKHAFQTGAFNNCDKFVEDAALLLDKLLGI